MADTLQMLQFGYHMELDFENGSATNHAFTLHCIPQETEEQHVISYTLRIDPPAGFSYGKDSFGNAYCYGFVKERHEAFLVDVSGVVEHTGRPDMAEAPEQMLYRQQTEATRPGTVITSLYSMYQYSGNKGIKRNESGGGAEAAAVAIRDLVHSHMKYAPGETNTKTSAEEAAARGRGVCQDYAHVMLSLCRMAGIPCRYTAGLLIGEGASHAWVEVCDHGRWISFDPTNPASGMEEKVIFSYGRDAGDCEINKGVFQGSPVQVQKVEAVLEKI